MDNKERITALETKVDNISGDIKNIRDNHLHTIEKKIDEMPEKMSKIFVTKGRFKPVEWFTYAVVGGAIVMLFRLISNHL